MERPNAAANLGQPTPLMQKLSAANETTWLRIGATSELMNDADKALFCYENVLRHNPYNVKALTQVASICRVREQYPKAVEYFQRIINIDGANGEIWGALGHCYLMMDDLQRAYNAYQQALYHLQNPKDPNLWYGIGILYDRYGSWEHAEEAFAAVLKMDANFEKSNEIYFRLGIIYKQQHKHDKSLECFKLILGNPPAPLVQADIWFQIGHVYELKKDYIAAKEAYERVLKENPNHAKVLQQLGWLYHHNTSFGNQEVAITHLRRSLESDQSDGQTWYLLGRCYMAQQKYRKAYDAYQQAVYRDGRNPTFWCSIGVLYYQINQYRDALDAYSRAIRLNPYLSEVWYDLGTLYESCNQIPDSLDAYQRAAELDPNNKHIQQRLNMLRQQPQQPQQQTQLPPQPQQPQLSIPSMLTVAGPNGNIKPPVLSKETPAPSNSKKPVNYSPIPSVSDLVRKPELQKPMSPEMTLEAMKPRRKDDKKSPQSSEPDDEDKKVKNDGGEGPLPSIAKQHLSRPKLRSDATDADEVAEKEQKMFLNDKRPLTDSLEIFSVSKLSSSASGGSNGNNNSSMSTGGGGGNVLKRSVRSERSDEIGPEMVGVNTDDYPSSMSGNHASPARKISSDQNIATKAVDSASRSESAEKRDAHSPSFSSESVSPPTSSAGGSPLSGSKDSNAMDEDSPQKTSVSSSTSEQDDSSKKREKDSLSPDEPGEKKRKQKS